MLYHGLLGISMTHFEKPCWIMLANHVSNVYMGASESLGLSFEDFKSLYNYWGFSEFHSPGNNNRNTLAEEEEPQDFAQIDP